MSGDENHLAATKLSEPSYTGINSGHIHILLLAKEKT